MAKAKRAEFYGTQHHPITVGELIDVLSTYPRGAGVLVWTTTVMRGKTAPLLTEIIGTLRTGTGSSPELETTECRLLIEKRSK